MSDIRTATPSSITIPHGTALRKRQACSSGLALCASMLLALAVIAQFSSADTYNMKDYWPILDKVSLTYLRQLNDTGSKFSIQYTATGPFIVGAYDDVFSVEYYQSSAKWTQFLMQWTDQYLILVQYDDSKKDNRKYTDVLEILPAVLDPAAVNQGIGNGGIYFAKDSSGTDTVRLLGAKIETITVPAGDYETLHVTLQRDWQEQSLWYGSETWDYWFAKDIGPVRRHRFFVTHDPSTTAPIAGSERDELAAAPVIADLSALMPPVADQATTGGFGSYVNDEYPYGYGIGVCWAMGYYYKTYQENLQRYFQTGTLPQTTLATTDPAGIISPYFLWNNGGGNHFHFAGELLRGYGAPTLQSYPTPDTVTSAVHFQEAEQFKSLGYASFFAHTPYVDYITQRFLSAWSNDIATLKAWLAPPLDAYGNQPPGDCFVIGIPVFETFLSYKQGVYGLDSLSNKRFLGFHAVCVVGCRDTNHAFRIVNSWGPGWGESGYAWLSYDFVQKYAIEAWRMRDSPAFGLDPNVRPRVVEGVYIYRTIDYQISYDPKLSGRIAVTSSGLVITGGHDGDTLKIMRRKGVTWGGTIQRIQTDGGFASLYTQAPVAEVSAAGNIGAMTAAGCHIQSLAARTIRSVSQAPQVNSIWQTLSQSLERHPAGWFEQTGQSLNNFADTEIIETITSVPAPIKRALTIKLNGVRLDGLVSGANVSLSMASKKFTPVGVPPFVACSGATSESAVSVLGTLAIAGNGSAVRSSEILCGGLKSANLTGLRWASKLRAYRAKDVLTFADYLPSDWSAPQLHSDADIKSMLIKGGDIAFTTISSAGKIWTLQAGYVKWARADGSAVYTGGRFGAIDRPTTAAVLIAGYGQESDATLAGIQLIRGDLGVAGRFIAGAHTSGEPNYLGAIKTISVLPKAPGQMPKPLIQGDAYTNSGAIIRFLGDTAPGDHFTEHHP